MQTRVGQRLRRGLRGVGAPENPNNPINKVSRMTPMVIFSRQITIPIRHYATRSIGREGFEQQLSFG
jgi:hypothetical protein